MAVVIAASTSPIASSGRSAADSSEPAAKRRKRPKAVAPLPTSGTEVCRKRIFLDLFAGDGGLGKALGRFMEVVLDDPFAVGAQTSWINPLSIPLETAAQLGMRKA